LAGLQDRSSRPHRLRQPTPQATIDRIETLRRQRLTGKAIAAETGVSPATVSRVLKRLGLNRLGALEPAEPPRRYQRERPGELIHMDHLNWQSCQSGRGTTLPRWDSCDSIPHATSLRISLAPSDTLSGAGLP
jgi:hypothetical protein